MHSNSLALMSIAAFIVVLCVSHCCKAQIEALSCAAPQTLRSNTRYELSNCPPATFTEPPVVASEVENVVVNITNAFRRFAVTNSRNVTVYMSGVVPPPDIMDPKFISNWALLLLDGDVYDVRVILDNVTWGTLNGSAESSSIASVEASSRPAVLLDGKTAALLAGLHVVVRRSAIASLVASHPQAWVHLPAICQDINVDIEATRLDAVWSNPIGGGPFRWGCIQVDVSFVARLSVSVAQSKISIVEDDRITRWKPTEYIERGRIQFLLLKDKHLSVVNETVTDVSLTLKDTTCWVGETAHMSTAVQLFGVFDEQGFNATNITFIAISSSMNLTGHDQAIVFELEAVPSAVSIRVSMVACHVYLRAGGPGDKGTSMAREASIVKFDKSIVADSNVFLEGLVVDISAQGPTLAFDEDQSPGITAIVMHVGVAHRSVVLLRNIVGFLAIPFSYPSRIPQDRAKMVSTSTSALLVDSDGLSKRGASSVGSRFEVDGCRLTLSQTFYPSELVLAGPFGFIVASGLFSLTISSVNASFVARNCVVVQGGLYVPSTASLFAASDFGVFATGAVPRANASTVLVGNTITIINVSITHDDVSAARLRATVPLAVVPFMSEILRCNVLIVSGVHEKTSVTLHAVHQVSLKLSVTLLVLRGATMPDNPFYAIVLEQMGIGQPVTQLRDAVVAARSIHVLNGSIMALQSTSRIQSYEGAGLSLSVADSTFAAPSPSSSAFTTGDAASKPLPMIELALRLVNFTGYRSLVSDRFPFINWTNQNRVGADRFALDCLLWDGEPLFGQSQSAAMNVVGIPRAYIGRQSNECPGPHITPTQELTQTRVLIVPYVRRSQLGSSTSSLLTLGAIVASVINTGTSVLMQRSLAVLALCNSLDDGESPPAATDSPLQLRLGGSYTLGTVLGNAVFVVVYVAVAAFATSLPALKQQAQKRWSFRSLRKCIGSNPAGLPGLVIGPLNLVLQPTIVAAVQTLLYGNRNGGGVALAVFGLLAFCGTGAALSFVGCCRQRCASVPTAVFERKSNRRKVSLDAHKGDSLHLWAAAIGKRLVATYVTWVCRTRDERTYFGRFSRVFDGLTAGRVWFLWVEFATAVACGVLSALQFESASDCRAQLIANEVLSACLLVLCAAWAYNGLLWNLNYAANTALMVVAGALMLAEDVSSAELVCLLSAWSALAFAAADVVCVVACYGWRDGLRRLLRLGASDSTSRTNVWQLADMFPATAPSKTARHSDSKLVHGSDLFLALQRQKHPPAAVLSLLIEMIVTDTAKQSVTRSRSL